MKTLRIPSLVVLVASTVALAGQVGASEDQGGEETLRRGRVTLNYTKWVLNGGAGPFMQGFVQGDIEGGFIGEIFELKASARVPSLFNRIEAIYQVKTLSPGRSFTALVQGGQTVVALGGKGLLEGFILSGWRTGAPVHVAYTVMQGDEDCEPPAPPDAGRSCFVGTITIDPVPVPY